MIEYKFKKELKKEFKNTSPVADAVVFVAFVVIFAILAVAFGG